MSKDVAHEGWRQISEVVFGIPFLAAIALQLIAPLSFHYGFLTPVIIFGDAALFIIGVAFIFLARRKFAHRGQPTDPGLPTSKINTTGVFSVSRNPIYLGATCLLSGISLAFNLPWVLVLLLPALIACHYVLKAPEERYLSTKFGREYHKYTASVHRWIGSNRRPR
jgi:protein-S-isoprenylcysteine O-methyltransferase Ste14